MDDSILLCGAGIYVFNIFTFSFKRNILYLMKIVTNISDYPELKLDEKLVVKCIKNHFRNVNAPIYIYIDPKLKNAYGLHACRSIKEYETLPKIVKDELVESAKENKNHWHKINLSYQLLERALNKRRKSKDETSDWILCDEYDYYYAVVFYVLTHELQHAYQVERGNQYKKENWKQYEDEIGDFVDLEFDAEVGAIRKGPRLLRSYCGK